jgi:hypothetical protein
MIMSINDKEILNLFTSDDEISNEIIKNYNKYFSIISKYKDFDLENILIKLPYMEKLKNKHLENIERLEQNQLNPNLIFMTTYLVFRTVLGNLMTLNNLTQPVIDKINTLFIDIFPNELPDIFNNGIFIQSKKSVLFDNVNRIVIYKENYNEKDCFRIFIFCNNGYAGNASIAYSSILGKSIDEIDNLKLQGKFKNINAILYRKALLFCLVFAILIKSENTPITIKDTNKSDNIKKNKTLIENKKVEGWIERTLYINNKYLSKDNKLMHNTLYKDDKILKEVKVSAYLRRKPHSKDEYIYIDSFTSTRWVIEGNKKITYYLK